MTTHDDSVFTICAQSRIVSHPHQNRSKNRTDFAAAQRRQANATGLHSCGQPGSHGRRGENAYSNSQPRGGPKRTESGPWKDHTRVSYSALGCGDDVQHIS
jgi:hypothetical protein